MRESGRQTHRGRERQGRVKYIVGSRGGEDSVRQLAICIWIHTDRQTDRQRHSHIHIIDTDKDTYILVLVCERSYMEIVGKLV